MAHPTPIEWCDASWNPIGGCSIHSPGCTNCYAQALAGTRLAHLPLYAGTTSPSKAGPVFNGHLTAAPDDHDVWTWPLRWRGAKSPRRGAGARSVIFVGDMADLFHKGRPEAVIDRVFAVIALCPKYDFQILTKRADRMREYLSTLHTRAVEIAQRAVWLRIWDDPDGVAGTVLTALEGGYLTNLWCGVSCEDQRRADERTPDLLATPAAVRFLSCEPLLGPIDLTTLRNGASLGEGQRWVNALGTRGAGFVYEDDDICSVPRIDWVITAGESGRNARSMHPDWARSLRDQCQAAGVAFFFKQHGEWLSIHQCGHLAQAIIDADEVPYGEWHADGGFIESCLCGSGHGSVVRVGKKAAGRILDGREWSEFPR